MCAAVEEREENAGGQPRLGSSRKAKDAIAPARPNDVEIRDLSREETEAMIQRNRVGRLAFSLHDRVDIEPIHYIYERGWLYGRTSEGEKIAVVKHNQWIAFEIDEVARSEPVALLFHRRCFGPLHVRDDHGCSGYPLPRSVWALVLI